MGSLQSVFHICLTVSTDSAEEAMPLLLDFYSNKLGMKVVPALSNQEGYFDAEQMKKAASPFRGVLQFGEDGMFLSEAHFLHPRGAPRSAFIDLWTCREPEQLSSPSERFYESGLRSPTLLVKDLEGLHRRLTTEGVEFISAPVTVDMGPLGQAFFLVAKDPIGNLVELIETDEVADARFDGVQRIFSVNSNCIDVERSLSLYRDVLGMGVAHEVEVVASRELATAFGFKEPISVKIYLMSGADPAAPTYYALTSWQTPAVVQANREHNRYNTWFRSALSVDSIDSVVHDFYDRTKDRVTYIGDVAVMQAPHDESKKSAISMFWDDDGVAQELLCFE